MLRWFKVGQRWHATWRVATLNQLEIISLNGRIQQGKWQFTLTLQVAHLLAMVHVVLFKSCTCNYAFIYFLHLQTCMHFISYLHFLTLRKFTGERYRNITTHLRWHVWKQTSKQSRCSTTRRCCESHGCRQKGGDGGPEESVADSVSDKLLRIRSVGISEGWNHHLRSSGAVTGGLYGCRMALTTSLFCSLSPTDRYFFPSS